jgi:hypothetical protein
LGSMVPAHFPLTRPFRLPSLQERAAKGNGARCGTCAFVLVFMIVAAAREEARAGDRKNCREQTSVQSLLRQAEDTKQSYDERRKAYENAARVCSHDPSIYIALAAPLLEHQEGESALNWAGCPGLEIAPQDPNPTVQDGGGFPKSLSGIPEGHD